MVPTYLLVVNAFSSASSYTGQVNWWPTSAAVFDNMAAAWREADFGPAILNSLLYAVLCGAVAVFVAGFAVTAVPGRGKVLVFWVVYAGSLFPLQVFLRPLFTGYPDTGLYDTQFGLFLSYTARLDGANSWRAFARFYLPLSKSALAAAFIFQFG